MFLSLFHLLIVVEKGVVESEKFKTLKAIRDSQTNLMQSKSKFNWKRQDTEQIVVMVDYSNCLSFDLKIGEEKLWKNLKEMRCSIHTKKWKKERKKKRTRNNDDSGGRVGEYSHERKLRGHSNCQPKIQFIVAMCRRTLMSVFNHWTDIYKWVHADGIEEEEEKSFLFFTFFFETPKKVPVFSSFAFESFFPSFRFIAR